MARLNYQDYQEQQVFQAVKSDREITHAAKDPKRKASVPSQFAMEFESQSLLDAMQTSGVSLVWMVKKYVEIADNPNETGATRMQAMKELRRLQLIGATLHPKIKRYLESEGPTEEASIKTSRQDPFSQLQPGNPNLKVASNG